MIIWAKAVACLSMSLVLLTGCGVTDQGRRVEAASRSGGETLELVQMHAPADGQDMAVVKTSLGNIRIVLYEQFAPQTVKQFKRLVEEKFYDGKRIFSVDPDSKLMFAGAEDDEGTKGRIATDDGKAVEPEVTPRVWHFSGAVSAFGTQTGIFNRRYVSDSRFFIVGDQPAQLDLLDQMEENDFPNEVIQAYKKLGGCPQYTGFYTVFGQVIDGMEIVNEIVAGGVNEETGAPLAETVIESVSLTTYSSEEADVSAVSELQKVS